MNKHMTGFALRLARANRVARWMSTAGDALRACELTLGPVLDLALRLWLAHIFLLSGLVKIGNWDTAIALATYEYPVSWLNPAAAAYLGAGIELIGAVLLALGLGTRLAAIPMLILSLVIQFEYRALNEHVFWTILFGWYAVMGAGVLSLDRIIGRGIFETALPLAQPVSRFLENVTRVLGPIYQAFIRLWLALVFLISGLAPSAAQHLSLLRYQYQVPIAPGDASQLSAWALAVLCPVLLALGLCTRLTALALIVFLAGMGMSMDVAPLAHIDYMYWMALLALLVAWGPGALSLDEALKRKLRRVFPQIDGKPAASLEELPQVVIVGAGFGGIAAARALRHAACRVTLVDRHNYHLFQPLLYQVATASLSPADIATPIRELFRDQFNARVLLGTVTGIDTAKQEVLMADRRLRFDYLIIATGARHGYFGRDEWETLAPGLKQIDDATHIRRRLLLAFERAENAVDRDEQQRLLTFVIVGGGPTGVELAGAIAELAQHGMAREFRNIDPATARVLLIQSGPRLLPAFPETLSVATERSLAALGVEVLTNSRVEHVDAGGVVISGRRIESRTVFWAAGVMASPAAEWLNAEHDRSGRLKVGSDLSVAGLPNVFAIGDTALSEAWNGQAVPGLAPAAKQGGAYVAEVLRARLEGRRLPAPFRYRHMGSLATIGRKAAVADFGWLRLNGAVAWWFWGAIHVLFLAGMRSRILVAVQWFWAYLTFRRGTRLITGGEDMPPQSAVVSIEPESGTVNRGLKLVNSS